MRKISGRKQAQGILAKEMTRLVHGDEGLASAERITGALFSGELSSLSEGDLEQLRQDGLPASTIKRDELEGKAMTQMFAEEGVVATGKQVKDALGRNAVLINGDSKSMADNMNLTGCFAEDKAMHGPFLYGQTWQEEISPV